MGVLDLMENTRDIVQTTPDLSALPPVNTPTAWPALLVMLTLIGVLAYGRYRASPNRGEWRIPESWKRAAPILGFHLLTSWPVALALLIVWLER